MPVEIFPAFKLFNPDPSPVKLFAGCVNATRFEYVPAIPVFGTTPVMLIAVIA
jgi:hypothetical protein